jgi:hypothetical protein
MELTYKVSHFSPIFKYSTLCFCFICLLPFQGVHCHAHSFILNTFFIDECKCHYQQILVILGPEVFTYNPSCFGGRDQDDRGSKPAQANSLQDPISRKPITK